MKTRNCVICGSVYEYCPRCRQYDSLPKWKINYCSEGCKNIYDTINKYAFKHITAKEAYEVVGNINTKIINDEVNLLISEIKEKCEPKDEIKPKKKKKYFEDVVETTDESVNLD